MSDVSNVSKGEVFLQKLIADNQEATLETIVESKARVLDSNQDAEKMKEENSGELARALGKKLDQVEKKPLNERAQFISRKEKTQEAKEVPKVVEEAAKNLSAKTAGELRLETLRALYQINQNTSSEEAIQIVEEFVKEPHLVHEALGFLADTTEGQQKANMQKAKDDHYKENKDQIEYGLEIGIIAREMSRSGEGEIKSLRDEIAQIMREDKSSHDIFSELHDVYGSYKPVSKKLKVYMHYLGEATKDTTVERPHLQALGTALRKLQSVKQVYAFFNKMSDLIEYEAAGL